MVDSQHMNGHWSRITWFGLSPDDFDLRIEGMEEC